MLYYSTRSTCCRCAYVTCFALLLLWLYHHKRTRGIVSDSGNGIPQISIPSTSFRSHDFRRYPQSRPSIEYDLIQIDNIAEAMFRPPQSTENAIDDFSQPLKFSESKFRSAPVPIIWLDAKGDVRWNRVAQHEMLTYLLEKQFPEGSISTCLSRQLFILEQWSMGFFSRHHCLIEHFGQTLYSPSMALLTPKRFGISNAGVDDFRAEGILRYYQSISLCSSYLHHPQLKPLHDRLGSMGHNPGDTKVINDVHQLLERDETTVKFKYSHEIWKFGYDHVPHRRWLFDRNREQTKRTITYHSPVQALIDHSNEHIYYENNASLNLSQWYARNSPQGPPKNVLNGTTTKLTIPDQVFTSFLRYMFLLFFSPLAPRIQTSAKLLAHHWSEYLADKHNQPYQQALSKMAAIFIRRGDKMPEDSFWHKHKRWRNISMYVRGIVDEEKRRRVKYTSIFVMTDDSSVMASIQDYATTGLSGAIRDEPYARQHLHGREILYNVFAPQSCFDPFVRIGFDQFLVNTQFVTDHAALVVGHTDSNVGRYLEEIIYVNRQHRRDAQTLTYVINAPDTLE